MINKKTKIIALILALIVACGFMYAILKAISGWFDSNTIVFNKPIQVEFKPLAEIKERNVESAEIIKIIETIPAPEDLESEPEKLIYKYFGIEHYRMAIAVSKCEGLNHPADGWNTNSNGSIDVGYMRINSINFKIEGCSLQEIVFPEGNIACAYKLWDRGDKEEGNKRGNFNAWVGYTNGCALTKYE